MNGRHDKKPLHLFLELYVLWVIGEIDRELHEMAKQSTPHLQSALSGEGEWFEVIESYLMATPDSRTDIRDLWAKNQELARENGLTLTPQEFAQMVVETNFPL